jgi:hypothetical protein
MALSTIVDSIDGLPANVVGAYIKQEDGKYRLDIDGGFKTLDEVAGLQSALDKERKAARDAHGKIKVFDGIDPEEAKKALAAYANLDAATKKANEDAEAAFKARLAPIEERANTAEKNFAQLQAKYNDQVIGYAFANSKAINEFCHEGMTPEAVRRVLAPYVSIEDNDLVFRDDAGSKILNADGVCDPERAIKELLTKTTIGRGLLKASSGAGTQPGVGTGRAAASNPWKTGNQTQQNEIAATNWPEAKRLAKEAGVELG